MTLTISPTNPSASSSSDIAHLLGPPPEVQLTMLLKGLLDQLESNLQSRSRGNTAPSFGSLAPNGTVPLRDLVADRTSNHFVSPFGRPSNTPINFNGRSYMPKDIFHGFRQGERGNCVEVGAIKAAMVRFGPDNVFQNVQKNGNGYEITMRDGVKVNLSAQELQQAKAAARFHGNDPQLVDQASFMFAAMAKRAQMEGEKGARTFGQALAALNTGESYLRGPHLLGIDRYVKKISPREIPLYSTAVGASANHVVFSPHAITDHYGQPVRAGLSDGNGRALQWAYALV
jgi:hypothetical protein